MADQFQPFARVEETSRSGEAWLKLGWSAADGAEMTTLRLPLSPLLQALSRDLRLGLSLGPTGVIALTTELLPEDDLGELLLSDGLPRATLANLVASMLELVTEVSDESDGPDLERLAKDLERAARDIRATVALAKAKG